MDEIGQVRARVRVQYSDYIIRTTTHKHKYFIYLYFLPEIFVRTFHQILHNSRIRTPRIPHSGLSRPRAALAGQYGESGKGQRGLRQQGDTKYSETSVRHLWDNFETRETIPYWRKGVQMRTCRAPLRLPKFPTSFTRVPMWNTLSRESQNFHTSFHVCKHGSRHSKDQTRKWLDLEYQMF